MALVERLPEAFPTVHKGLRRALVSRFPYAIYYRLLDASTLEVVACLHNRRHPRHWRRRG